MTRIIACFGFGLMMLGLLLFWSPAEGSECMLPGPESRILVLESVLADGRSIDVPDLQNAELVPLMEGVHAEVDGVFIRLRSSSSDRMQVRRPYERVR